MNEVLIGYGLFNLILLTVVYLIARKLVQILRSLDIIEKELEMLHEEIQQLRNKVNKLDEKTDLVKEIEKLVQQIQIKKEEDRDKVKAFLLRRFSNELAG